MSAAPAQALAAVLESYPFQVGQLIAGSPYRVTEFIGAGGMGCVYEVEHVTLGKRFVLKSLLSSGRASAELAERLRNEWRALAQLESPHIVAVTDAGVCSAGAPYFVMERLEGETLRALMRRRRRVPPRLALRIAGEMLEGLGAAHLAHVVHRDVKPANVFITRTGQVKILDFGVAKVGFGAQGLTAEGMSVGTPRYMAPEQVRGVPVDGRADVYAVGLILFELLTGSRPFDDSREGLTARLCGSVPSLRERAPDLPPLLDAYVARLLARDPRRRPATALAAHQELTSVAASLPLSDAVSELELPPTPRCPPLVERLLRAPEHAAGAAEAGLLSAATRHDGARSVGAGAEGAQHATRRDGAERRAPSLTVRLPDAELAHDSATGTERVSRSLVACATCETPNDTFPEHVSLGPPQLLPTPLQATPTCFRAEPIEAQPRTPPPPRAPQAPLSCFRKETHEPEQRPRRRPGVSVRRVSLEPPMPGPSPRDVSEPPPFHLAYSRGAGPRSMRPPMSLVEDPPRGRRAASAAEEPSRGRPPMSAIEDPPRGRLPASAVAAPRELRQNPTMALPAEAGHIASVDRWRSPMTAGHRGSATAQVRHLSPIPSATSCGLLAELSKAPEFTARGEPPGAQGNLRAALYQVRQLTTRLQASPAWPGRRWLVAGAVVGVGLAGALGAWLGWA